MDLKQVISKKDKTIEKLRREVRSKISQVKEIQVKLLTLEKSSKKSNMQLRENIEDLQDENRKLMRETLDFINKIQIFEYFLNFGLIVKLKNTLMINERENEKTIVVFNIYF